MSGTFFLVSVALVTIKVANTMTVGDLRRRFSHDMMSCQVEQDRIDLGQIRMLQKGISPDEHWNKCMMACALRKLGVLNEYGMFDVERGHDIAQLLVPDSAKHGHAAHGLVEVCSVVNSVPVLDAHLGCERANLIYRCIIENGPHIFTSADTSLGLLQILHPELFCPPTFYYWVC